MLNSRLSILCLNKRGIHIQKNRKLPLLPILFQFSFLSKMKFTLRDSIHWKIHDEERKAIKVTAGPSARNQMPKIKPEVLTL